MDNFKIVLIILAVFFICCYLKNNSLFTNNVTVVEGVDNQQPASWRTAVNPASQGLETRRRDSSDPARATERPVIVQQRGATTGHSGNFPMNSVTSSEVPRQAVTPAANEKVLDMFGGSFTTAIVANKLNRIGIGFELRKDLFEECIKKNLTNNNVLFQDYN